MQITPLKNLNTLYSVKPSCNKTLKNIAFSGNVTKLSGNNYTVFPTSILKKKMVELRHESLVPITKEEEYEKILNEILNYKFVNKWFHFNIIDLRGYANIDRDLMGLIAYCGAGDISCQINSWLTGRNFDFQEQLPNEKISKIVRALEYSLKKLDEKYGKFEGKVFRAGYFNPKKDVQFYSSSKNIECTIRHTNKSAPQPDTPYSIIKVKNGHNIIDFQNDTNTQISLSLAESEEEILLDRFSRFKKVAPKDYTNEDIEDILDIVNKTMGLKLKAKDLEDFSRNVDTLDYISIWEEI